MESPRTPGGHAAPVQLVESPRGEGTELGNEWVRAYASKSIPKSISGTFFFKNENFKASLDLHFLSSDRVPISALFPRVCEKAEVAWEIL